MIRYWNPITAVALALAALISAGLLVAAAVVPVYGTETASASLAPDGTLTSSSTTSGGATLVAVNGLGSLVVVAVPLLVTLVVGALLLRATGWWGYAAAWIVTGLYTVLCVLALMSIGIFLAPVAMVLVVACATARIPVSALVPDPAAA